jgi:hypothetical protein
MVIRRVSPVSVAKIAGLLYSFIGLMFGAIFSLFALAGFGPGAGDNAGFGPFFGVGAIVVLPIAYGCFGFIMTAIMALLYNVVSGLVGGVEVDVA